jgi:hypothetical protein
VVGNILGGFREATEGNREQNFIEAVDAGVDLWEVGLIFFMEFLCFISDNLFYLG